MNCLPSASDPGQNASGPGSSFGLLHEKVRRWVWERGWRELRDFQDAAIRPILACKQDVILSAATASGKTEGAFLPICSRLIQYEGPGTKVLYVSPLKALINQQFQRIADICERLQIPVHRWHGDVADSRKKKFRRDPDGVLLITPESLEALFVRHGSMLGRLFDSLQYVVLDELHTFFDNERGRQLQSLLHRLEVVLRRPVCRVALSATLGDVQIAAEFLRPGHASDVLVLSSADGGGELKLLIRGYLVQPSDADSTCGQRVSATGIQRIADDLAKVTRQRSHLIFVDSRAEAESLSDSLQRSLHREDPHRQCLIHHGSLSKELRGDVETRLMEEVQGRVVVCTSTLELGIDIPSVESVAQVGRPSSVAGLRQRVGRSGRRVGEPGVLRVFVREERVDATTNPEHQLSVHLVEAMAQVALLIQGYCEPPILRGLHLSTLIQQLLSVIAERGGVSAAGAFQLLCERGPFADVSKSSFALLLHSLGAKELLTQDSSGTLHLGLLGERIVAHHSFFAAFLTPEEYRVVADGRTLGSLPVFERVSEGSFLIFSGRRWQVVSVDDKRRVILLTPARGGRAPLFGRGAHLVSDRVRQEMRAILESLEFPCYLDPVARDLLVAGRSNYDCLGLRESCLLNVSGDVLLFPWAGDVVMNTICLQMLRLGFDVAVSGVALVFYNASSNHVEKVLRRLLSRGFDDPVVLAELVTDKRIEKYDDFLPEQLLLAGYASRMLDCASAQEAVRRALQP